MPSSYQTLVSVQALGQNLTNPNWIVVDCRFSLKDTEQGRRAYSEGHIPGARYAHLDDDLSGSIIPGQTGRHPFPEPAQFAAKLGSWGIRTDTQVIAYDDMGGAIAARLWIMLRWLGHNNVAVLDGGWPAWLAADLPSESDTPAITPTVFTPTTQKAMLANTEAVEQATTNDNICLLDARAAARYAGEHEPIDPVAGHIPSALSFPWADNLGPDGHFRSADELRTRFAAVDTGNSISYCGSGVTAAHNLLAIAHAGLPSPRLYHGSWSAWITDSHHKIAKSDT
ncbi:MAG: sulfurtransferase [Bacteroidota bacterium]